MEGTARPAGPGCGTRGRRCPWAAAGPGRASRRRTQPHTATQAPPVWRVPEGPEGTGGLRADAPIRICHRAPLGREAGYPGGGTHTVGPGRASHSDTSAAGVEGAGGPGCGARGRRQGLAGLVTATQAPPVWRVPEGTEGTGGLRDRPLRAVGSRVAISRAAGPDGTRNTSGAQNTINIPQHAHSDACPHAIQA